MSYDESDAAWEPLCGGPCDGRPEWVNSRCWAVIISRDSDRRSWSTEHVELGEKTSAVTANEAHLYMRSPGGALEHIPNGLRRVTHEGHLVWVVCPDAPGDPR
jgi:hypothetical protein